MGPAGGRRRDPREDTGNPQQPAGTRNYFFKKMLTHPKKRIACAARPRLNALSRVIEVHELSTFLATHLLEWRVTQAARARYNPVAELDCREGWARLVMPMYGSTEPSPCLTILTWSPRFSLIRVANGSPL